MCVAYIPFVGCKCTVQQCIRSFVCIGPVRCDRVSSKDTAPFISRLCAQFDSLIVFLFFLELSCFMTNLSVFYPSLFFSFFILFNRQPYSIRESATWREENVTTPIMLLVWNIYAESSDVLYIIWMRADIGSWDICEAADFHRAAAIARERQLIVRAALCTVAFLYYILLVKNRV